MYYALILLSVVMFGFCFGLNAKYSNTVGRSLKISLVFSALSSTAGLIVLLIMNSFKIEFTVFTFIMSLFSVANGILITFCGFQALGTINLSLYSLFMMLGGMVLPFLQGIIFYGEALTVSKIICFVLITVALFFTIDKKMMSNKKATLYYVAIFILNGMSGVISKVFTTAGEGGLLSYFTSTPFEKTSPAGFSILGTILTIVISLLILLLFFTKKDGEEKIKHTPLSIAIASGAGILNRVANYILVFALAFVDTSVQYPMVTGGVMIVSTVMAFFTPNKPKRNEIISVCIAFVALLALFLIPV